MKRSHMHYLLLSAAFDELATNTAPSEICRLFKRAKRVEMSFAIQGIAIQFLLHFAKAPWRVIRAEHHFQATSVSWDWSH